jgi:hypothetical protein
MDKDEFNRKYVNLRILKSAQEYLKSEGEASTAVYPIRVPDDMLYQVLEHRGAEKTDELIHHIFRLGLTLWSERLFNDVFGSPQTLQAFIELVKKRSKDTE